MKRLETFFIFMLISACLPVSAADPIKVRLDLRSVNGWEINPMLLGTFSEEHWGDITPGIYEQYVVNPSFEEWYVKREDDREPQDKSNVIWRDVPRTDGVAFPWETDTIAGAPCFEYSSEALNTERAQRIRIADGDVACIFQRLALPFYRVQSYNVSFYVRTSGDVRLKLFISSHDVRDRLCVAEIDNLSDGWNRHQVTLEVSRQEKQHLGRYGVYNMGFEVEGNGVVDLDLVTLFPADCVEGIFNPETIAYFRHYGPTLIRWPGGNFTSGYHWYDGIGRLEDRKSLPNLAWGGLCTNHVGIDEMMRFCELTEVIPVIGVGYDENEISPEEVADWVEYCNGDITTPMGKLRAENGHPLPYNIKYWGVGNEVYGRYQIGYQPDPVKYAAGLADIVKAMKKSDPSIKIIASAFGAHNHWRKPSEWTEKLVGKAGEYIDYLDVHSYVYGPRSKEVRKVEGTDVIRAFLASNHEIDEYIDNIREVVTRTGNGHIKLAFLEWGVLPRLYYTRCRYAPNRASFVNMLCTSAYFNEFIRNGDFVHMGAQHNFSFYVQPVTAHAERVNPRTLLYRHYALMSGGRTVDIDISGMPTYDIEADWENIGAHENVPEVDILAVKKDDKVYIALTNRNPGESYDLRLQFKGRKVNMVKGTTYTSEKPFEPLTWRNIDEVEGYAETPSAFQLKSGNMIMTLPGLSYTFLVVDIR